MRFLSGFCVIVALVGVTMFPAMASATDVDGPDDCVRTPVDFGDAPEGVNAYPGVPGHFPTCLADTPPGTQTTVCPPISTAPGPTGFVRHQHNAADSQFWLGCAQAGGPPQGIDSEADGKVNATGGPQSACDPLQPVDCVEAAFGMSFGQDECYGSSDAGVAAPPVLMACNAAAFSVAAYSCAATARQVVLNVLVDLNHDGDWNDNLFQCGGSGACVYEWEVKNQLVVLQPGCNSIPITIFSGPTAGPSWMRITISDATAGAVPADFPWSGSAGIAGQSLVNGETEDYPIAILPNPPQCPNYQDWGDAPEDVQAYPLVPGHFPTCSAPGVPGTLDIACAPISTAPGLTGFVRHFSSTTDNVEFWLGCGDGITTLGVDGESDGKMNDTGGPLSACSQVPVDCVEFFGVSWGQDECYGDGVDAGIVLPATSGPVLTLKACQNAGFDFNTYNCKSQVDAFLNVLVDMNEDGDWNDNFLCPTPAGACAYEWAVKNVPIPLNPGCQLHTSPLFLVGPNAGKSWMRITLTSTPVPDDFPWNGSAGPQADGFFRGGETEDYPVVIRPDFVGVGGNDVPRQLSLAPPSPNPARDAITVRYELPREADVSLAVFDLAGRKLADLARGRVPAGQHTATWNFRVDGGAEFSAGYYVVRLRVGDQTFTRRGIRTR
jgi:hypothetical protein